MGRGCHPPRTIRRRTSGKRRGTPRRRPPLPTPLAFPCRHSILRRLKAAPPPDDDGRSKLDDIPRPSIYDYSARPVWPPRNKVVKDELNATQRAGREQHLPWALHELPRPPSPEDNEEWVRPDTSSDSDDDDGHYFRPAVPPLQAKKTLAKLQEKQNRAMVRFLEKEQAKGSPPLHTHSTHATQKTRHDTHIFTRATRLLPLLPAPPSDSRVSRAATIRPP